MRFHWIEEFLRTYILAAHQLIAVRTLGIMGYAYDAKAIRAMPLGPLIKLYARLGGELAIVAASTVCPTNEIKSPTQVSSYGSIRAGKSITSTKG